MPTPHRKTTPRPCGGSVGRPTRADFPLWDDVRAAEALARLLNRTHR